MAVYTYSNMNGKESGDVWPGRDRWNGGQVRGGVNCIDNTVFLKSENIKQM